MWSSRIASGVVALVATTAVPPSTSADELAAPTACDATDVEYTVSANLRVEGTVMGAGDGDYAIGPGKIVLRFDHDGSPGDVADSSVKMMSYAMRQRFVVVSRVAFWTTRVTSDIQSRAKTTAPSVVAEGSLTGRSLRWTNVGSIQSDGTLSCDGAFCGQFGAPPAGKSEFHMGSTTMQFKPFEFSPDMKTFSMKQTLTSKSESPKQESYVAFAGREVHRACVPASR